MKSMRKLVSMLLTLVMVWTLLPAGAFATDDAQTTDDAQAIEGAQSPTDSVGDGQAADPAQVSLTVRFAYGDAEEGANQAADDFAVDFAAGTAYLMPLPAIEGHDAGIAPREEGEEPYHIALVTLDDYTADMEEAEKDELIAYLQDAFVTDFAGEALFLALTPAQGEYEENLTISVDILYYPVQAQSEQADYTIVHVIPSRAEDGEALAVTQTLPGVVGEYIVPEFLTQDSELLAGEDIALLDLTEPTYYDEEVEITADGEAVLYLVYGDYGAPATTMRAASLGAWVFVSYELNGGTGVPPIDLPFPPYRSGATIQLKGNATFIPPMVSLFPPVFKKFVGWKVKGGDDTLYLPGTSFTLTENTTFVAQYAAQNVAVLKASDIQIANNNKVYGEDDPTPLSSVTAGLGGLTAGVDYQIEFKRDPGEDVGTYPLSVKSLKITNPLYLLAGTIGSSGTATFTVNPKAADGLTIVFEDKTEEYDGTVHSLDAARIMDGDDDVTEWFDIGYSDALSGTNVSDHRTVTATVTAKAGTNYTGTKTKDATLTITPRPVTITVKDSEKVFGSPDPAFEKESISGLVNDTDLDPITYVRTNAAEDAGTYEKVLDATYTPNTNYDVTVEQGDFEIKQAAGSGMNVVANGYSGVYDGNAHGITVTAIAGATIQYSLTPDNYSTTNPQYTDVTSGAVTVYYQVTHANYQTVTGSATVTITPRPLTVSAKKLWVTYGDDRPSGWNTPNYSGFASGEGASKLGTPITATTTYVKYSPVDGSPYAITLSGGGAQPYVDGNYQVTLVNGWIGVRAKGIGILSKGIQVSMANDETTYNGSPQKFAGALTVTHDGRTLTAGVDYTVRYEGADFDGDATKTDTGRYLVTVAITGKGNYTGLNGAVAWFTIKKAPLVLTVKGASVAFGEALTLPDGFAGVDVSTYLGGDGQGIFGSWKPAYTTNYVKGMTPAGAAGITMSINNKLPVLKNYVVTTVPGAVTVGTKAIDDLMLALDDEALVYNGTEQTYSKLLTVTNNGTPLQEGTHYTVTSFERPKRTHVSEGAATVTATVTGIGNYSGAGTTTATFTIAPAELEIYTDWYDLFFGDDVPDIEPLPNGLVGTDTLETAVTGLNPTTTYAKGDPVGGYPIDLGDAVAAVNGNYNITLNPDWIYVMPRELGEDDLTLNGDTLPYDGQQHGLTATTGTGLAIEYSTDSTDGDDGNWTNDAPQFTDAGTYTIWARIRGTGAVPMMATISGQEPSDNAGNYSGLTVVSATLTIEQVQLTITADDKTVVAGRAAPAFTYTISGFVNDEGESVLLDLNTLTFDDSGYEASGRRRGTGSYPIELNGDVSANNYEIYYVDGTLTVTAAPAEEPDDEPDDTPVPPFDLPNRIPIVDDPVPLGVTPPMNMLSSIAPAVSELLISDEAVPYGVTGEPANTFVDIEEEEVPYGATVKTGESGDTYYVFLAAGLAVMLLGAILLFARRRKQSAK